MLIACLLFYMYTYEKMGPQKKLSHLFKVTELVSGRIIIWIQSHLTRSLRSSQDRPQGSLHFLQHWGGASTDLVIVVPSTLDSAQPHKPFLSCFCSWCSEARQAKASLTSFDSGSTGLTNSKPGRLGASAPRDLWEDEDESFWEKWCTRTCLKYLEVQPLLQISLGKEGGGGHVGQSRQVLQEVSLGLGGPWKKTSLYSIK